MAAHFDPTRQRFDAVFDKGRLIYASSKMDTANTYASQQFRAKSRKVLHRAIKSTAGSVEVDFSGEIPANIAVSSISFVELVGMMKRRGISNHEVNLVFKKDSCYLLPANRDSDSDTGTHNSVESTGSGGESGFGGAPKKVKKRKMYVLVCYWFVLWAMLFLMLIVTEKLRSSKKDQLW